MNDTFPRMIPKAFILIMGLALGAACRKPPSQVEPATGSPAATTSASPSTASPAASGSPISPRAAKRTWSFDADAPDELPAGFDVMHAGGGKAGLWRVKADAGLRYLMQLDADPIDGRVLFAVTGDPLRDVRASVRCKPIAGQRERTCGLVLRFVDERNYYVAQTSALAKDVNLYLVKNGRRTQLAGWTGAVFGDAWHTIQIDAKGDHLEVSWDGTKVVEATDRTLPGPGKVGVLTEADSVTQFDDLSETPLDGRTLSGQR